LKGQCTRTLPRGLKEVPFWKVIAAGGKHGPHFVVHTGPAHVYFASFVVGHHFIDFRVKANLL